MGEDKQEWGWMLEGGEHAHGPCESRDAALVDARRYLGQGETVTVVLGTCDYIGVSGFIGGDVDDVLTQMDESVYDNTGLQSEDPVFDIPTEKVDAAQKALDAALLKWAEEWVNASGVWILQEEETLKVTAEGVQNP